MNAVHTTPDDMAPGYWLNLLWWLIACCAIPCAFGLGVLLGSCLVWSFDAEIRALFWAWANVNF